MSVAVSMLFTHGKASRSLRRQLKEPPSLPNFRRLTMGLRKYPIVIQPSPSLGSQHQDHQVEMSPVKTLLHCIRAENRARIRDTASVVAVMTLACSPHRLSRGCDFSFPSSGNRVPRVARRDATPRPHRGEGGGKDPSSSHPLRWFPLSSGKGEMLNLAL